MQNCCGTERSYIGKENGGEKKKYIYIYILGYILVLYRYNGKNGNYYNVLGQAFPTSSPRPLGMHLQDEEAFTLAHLPYGFGDSWAL